MLNPFVIFAWTVAVISTYFSIYYLLLYFESRNPPGNGRMKPPVTVLIPAHNEEEGIYRTLASLRDMDYPSQKLHVIVVDDGSGDGTRREVRRFIRAHPRMDVKLLVNPRNRGKAGALNRALKQVSTPFLVTMDADSEAHPGALKGLFEYADGVAVVAPCVLPRNRRGWLERVQVVEYFYSNYLGNLLSGFDAQLVAPGPFSLFRTDVLKEVGGFDEQSVAEDLEVVFRLRKKGYSMKLSPKAHVYTRIPHKLRDLIKQRRRWRLGFLDAAQKHPRGLDPRSEYGRQNLMNFTYAFLLVAIVFVGIHQFYNSFEPAIHFFRYVGLDILPYLKNLTLNLDLLRLDLQMILYTVIVVLITSIFIFMASGFHDEKIKPTDALLFIFAYGAAIATATVLAVYAWLKGDHTW
ncbi:MAG TPA: glycosyltransferase family 2 protein [archaeon]|nr:glycosyltransferase family 2 protein [archaeon]